jgi:N-acetylneuraminate synthase
MRKELEKKDDDHFNGGNYVMAEVRIRDKKVGDHHPCFIVAEIGINHNGDIEIAKQLIRVAKNAGVDAVKFQKRTPVICVPPEQRMTMRETPWGYISYMDYRERVEFNFEQYREIDSFCKEQGILWFVSVWDEPSVDYMEPLNVPCYKISSALLTNDRLLRSVRSKGRPVILSTGMSTLEEVDHAVSVLGKENLILLHTCSVYPAHYEELNLRIIPMLRERYEIPIGYSGHETGLPSSIAAVALGACMVERHITLDRAMWGSDHAASLEQNGITRLVRDIRLVELALGDREKYVLPREIPIMKRLRHTQD